MKKAKKNNTNKSIISEIKEEFKRHMGTLMEQMRKEVKTVGEGHSVLAKKIDNIGSELHSVKMAVVDNSRRLDNVDNGLKTVEHKLDKNLDNHEKRITKLEEKVLA